MTTETPRADAENAGAQTPPIPTRCGRCGYVARGLAGTTCPECAFDLTKVAYLRYADRGWLRTIVFGTNLIRVGAVGLLVTMVGGARWAARTLRSVGIDWLADQVLSRSLLVLFLSSAIVGAWMLSTPDPTYQLEDEGRGAKRSIERLGIGAAATLGAIRIFGDGVLPPMANALLTCAAMACGLLMVIRMASLVRDLLSRSESALADDAEKPSDSWGWMKWVIAGALLIGLMSLRSGATTAALAMERLALSVGVLLAAFSLLNLLKGTKAIGSELERAHGEGSPR